MYYGLKEHARSDWEQTTNGRPVEPAVRPAQPGKYRFFVGLTPDQFGYIVPAYAHAIYGVLGITGVGIGALIGEVPDPNRKQLRTCVAGKPAVACARWDLLGKDVRAEPACREWRRYKSALLRLHNPLQDFSLGSVRNK